MVNRPFGPCSRRVAAAFLRKGCILRDTESVMRWFSVILVFACMFGRAEDETPLEREMLTYYVSNLGSDENPGGKDMPFATFHRAQQQVKTLLNAGAMPPGGVTIVLKEGTYALKTRRRQNTTRRLAGSTSMTWPSSPARSFRESEKIKRNNHGQENTGDQL